MVGRKKSTKKKVARVQESDVSCSCFMKTHICNLDCWDIKLIKLSTLAITFALVSGFASLRNWIASVNWIWFVIVGIIFAIRPMRRVWGNCGCTK